MIFCMSLVQLPSKASDPAEELGGLFKRRDRCRWIILLPFLPFTKGYVAGSGDVVVDDCVGMLPPLIQPDPYRSIL